MRRTVAAVAIVCAAALLTWPFFIAPHDFLYIRYFDANTIFNPWWTIRGLISVWDPQAHLGYAHARELSYLSLQELLSAVLAPLGADFRNRLALSSTALLIFGAFFWYARAAFRDANPLLVTISAFFYAANPFVVAFVHDGYSGLLVDYALLPALLLIVQWSRKAQRPVLLSLIPIMLLLAGMYTLPSAAITLIGVLIFEWEYITQAIRRSAATRAATALGFALNAFWVIPLVYDLAIHPHPPILAESQGDIEAITRFGGFSNTVLLRSFPSIWSFAYGGPKECTACGWYGSPWFILAMATIAAVAGYGLWRARRWRLLAGLGATIVFATGFHYQDDLIGLPYQVLMGLPTFDIFRSAVKFSALTAFLYSIGILCAARYLPRHRYMMAMALLTLLVSVPYVTGTMIERNQRKAFPNFPVSIPPEYQRLGLNRIQFPDDHPTLLLPNMRLASYRWGAYGNDFLPALIGKPTIFVSYLPQPNANVDLLLEELTSPKTLPAMAMALTRVMGIGRVLYHSDVVGVPKTDPNKFGSVIANDGAVSIIAPPSPVPLFTESNDVIPTTGAAGIAAYAGLSGFMAVGYDAGKDSNNVCAGRTAFVVTPAQVEIRRRNFIPIPQLTCSLRARIDLITPADAHPSAVSLDVDGKNYPVSTTYGRDGLRHFISELTFEPNAHVFLSNVKKGGAFLALVVVPKSASLPHMVAEAKTEPFANLGFRFPASASDRVVGFNQSFDPSWQGYIKTAQGWRPISNFTLNFFANGWRVPAGATLVVVNMLSIASLIAAALSGALALCYLIVLLNSLRSRESIR